MEFNWLLNPQEKALFAPSYMYCPHMPEHKAPHEMGRDLSVRSSTIS